jgi:hypothetical protein
MSRNKLVALLVGSALLLLLAARGLWPAQAATAAPAIQPSALNGGCYIAAANVCKIHVDPFTLTPDSGQSLFRFRLQANGTTIYDFRTDVNNAPLGSYTPSLVMQDFGALCGRDYVLNLLGEDINDGSLLNLGQTGQFTCPANLP